MKKTSGITAINSRTSFPRKMIEKFVRSKAASKSLKDNAGKKRSHFSANYEVMDCSSALFPINGQLDILFDAQYPESISRISIPVQTTFLVTCTKESINTYKLTWSCCMS